MIRRARYFWTFASMQSDQSIRSQREETVDSSLSIECLVTTLIRLRRSTNYTFGHVRPSILISLRCQCEEILDRLLSTGLPSRESDQTAPKCRLLNDHVLAKRPSPKVYFHTPWSGGWIEMYEYRLTARCMNGALQTTPLPYGESPSFVLLCVLCFHG